MKLIALASCLGLIIGSGLIHGVYTERWSDPQDLESAAQRFEQFPLEVGPWKGEVLDTKTTKASGLAASYVVRYEHQQTGKKVTVFLGCGRPGKVSIHTPDACYAASGFSTDGKKTVAFGEKGGGASGQVFTDRFKKSRAGEQTNIRIYWTWYAGGAWTVSEAPRLQYHGQKVLHKLYVLHELEAPNEPPSPAVCDDLLPQLTQAIEAKVITPAR